MKTVQSEYLLWGRAHVWVWFNVLDSNLKGIVWERSRPASVNFDILGDESKCELVSVEQALNGWDKPVNC